MNRNRKIIFVTGTDTGVGKTLLSAMLVFHLRKTGRHALGLKPFCSGNRADAKLLREAQGRELTLDEINPYFYEEPVAPFAAVKTTKPVPFQDVVEMIQKRAEKCETLIVEGVGGVLVPLGKNYFVLDLILNLQCEVLLVAKNQLGTLNHTLLSLNALEKKADKTKLVLMETRKPDFSAMTNGSILKKISRKPLVAIPFLGENPCKMVIFEKNVKKIQKSLARLG